MAQVRLMRSKDDRMIAGVCGGVAAYFDLDAGLVRAGWALAVLLGGFGVLAYIVLWIALPEGAGTRHIPAIRIAEERYARGEITLVELQQIRKNLTS
ncbi:MAG: PspC domain-containing protein [Actinomycetota bacterium]